MTRSSVSRMSSDVGEIGHPVVKRLIGSNSTRPSRSGSRRRIVVGDLGRLHQHGLQDGGRAPASIASASIDRRRCGRQAVPMIPVDLGSEDKDLTNGIADAFARGGHLLEKMPPRFGASPLVAVTGDPTSQSPAGDRRDGRSGPLPRSKRRIKAVDPIDQDIDAIASLESLDTVKVEIRGERARLLGKPAESGLQLASRSSLPRTADSSRMRSRSAAESESRASSTVATASERSVRTDGDAWSLPRGLSPARPLPGRIHRSGPRPPRVPAPAPRPALRARRSAGVHPRSLTPRHHDAGWSVRSVGSPDRAGWSPRAEAVRDRGAAPGPDAVRSPRPASASSSVARTDASSDGFVSNAASCRVSPLRPSSNSWN